MTWPFIQTQATPQIQYGSALRGGVSPPRYLSTGYYPPDHVYLGAGVTATTAQHQLFYVPITVAAPQTFRGMSNITSTATSNLGKQALLGLFSDDSSTGGPGTLLHTFGLVTFSTTTAVQTALNTITLSRGKFWMAQWFATSVEIFRWTALLATQKAVIADIGTLDPINASVNPTGWLATTTYATAFPATAVAVQAVATGAPTCYLFV